MLLTDTSDIWGLQHFGFDRIHQHVRWSTCDRQNLSSTCTDTNNYLIAARGVRVSEHEDDNIEGFDFSVGTEPRESTS